MRTLSAFLANLLVLVNGQTEFTISLRGGTDYEGFIVTLIDSKYETECEGRICGYMWDDKDAAVACRQLGLGNSGIAYVGSQNFQFSGWKDRIHYYEFDCNGDEENLTKCKFESVKVEAQDCLGAQVAGIRCFKDYDIRLSESDTEGRVELYMDGNWVTVCDEAWDDNDAEVACRHFTGRLEQTRAVAVRKALFGEGTGTVGFAGFKCNGSESNLSECTYTKNPDSELCSHQRDAGVDCQGDACSSQPCQNNGRCQIRKSGNRVCTCDAGFEGDLCEAEAQNSYNPSSPEGTRQLGVVITITIVVCLVTFFLFILISYMIMKAVNRDVDKNVVVVIPTAPSVEQMDMEEGEVDVLW
ncbi:neurotrypsin-like [Antedon mediterranea]|uniref:neurotrypsin-like n=1 Tax=Antedon mediterranea TaxID=105859 RepID=UPI003AF49018